MHILLTLVSILIISGIFTYIAPKLKIPREVALIISGLLIGNTLLKDIIIKNHETTLSTLSMVALISLMFLAGIESSWKLLFKEKKDSLIIAVFSAIIPFIFGTAILYVFGYPAMTALITGVCLTITAEATKARTLLELKKIKTKVGSTMMSAGFIDDLLGIITFTLILIFLKSVYTREGLILIATIMFFFIGLTTKKLLGRDNKILIKLEKILLLFLIPFFFVSMGIHFELNSLILNPLIVVLIIVVATISKLIATLLTKPFTTFSYEQLNLIGWAMNSRGAIELALALIAFKASLIPIEIYSSLVLMTLITTLTFPFIITRIIKKQPKIMN